MTAGLFDPADLAAVADALACPPWCVAPTGHGASDDEVRQSGGISRHHRGVEILAVERPRHSAHPVTVRVEQLVDLDPVDGLTVEEPVVAVHGAGGADPGLSVVEAAAVARAITAAVTLLGGER